LLADTVADRIVESFEVALALTFDNGGTADTRALRPRTAVVMRFGECALALLAADGTLATSEAALHPEVLTFTVSARAFRLSALTLASVRLMAVDEAFAPVVLAAAAEPEARAGEGLINQALTMATAALGGAGQIAGNSRKTKLQFVDARWSVESLQAGFVAGAGSINHEAIQPPIILFLERGVLEQFGDEIVLAGFRARGAGATRTGFHFEFLPGDMIFVLASENNETSSFLALRSLHGTDVSEGDLLVHLLVLLEDDRESVIVDAGALEGKSGKVLRLEFLSREPFALKEVGNLSISRGRSDFGDDPIGLGARVGKFVLHVLICSESFEEVRAAFEAFGEHTRVRVASRSV